MAARLALSSGGTSARLLISPTAGGTQASRGSPTSQRSSHNRSCPPSSGDRVGGEHVRSVFGTDAVGVQAKSWREFLMHKNAALVPHSLLRIFPFLLRDEPRIPPDLPKTNNSPSGGRPLALHPLKSCVPPTLSRLYCFAPRELARTRNIPRKGNAKNFGSRIVQATVKERRQTKESNDATLYLQSIVICI